MQQLRLWLALDHTAGEWQREPWVAALHSGNSLCDHKQLLCPLWACFSIQDIEVSKQSQVSWEGGVPCCPSGIGGCAARPLPPLGAQLATWRSLSAHAGGWSELEWLRCWASGGCVGPRSSEATIWSGSFYHLSLEQYGRAKVRS